MIKLVHPLSRAPLNVWYFSALKNDILLDKMDRNCVLWLTIALNTINFQLEDNDNESEGGREPPAAERRGAVLVGVSYQYNMGIAMSFIW